MKYIYKIIYNIIFYFKLVLLLIFLLPRKVFPKKIVPKTVLLIRIDGIGDYILFRNFIEFIKNSQIYKNSKLTFLGNSIFKELVENFENSFIDECIWINRNKFYTNFFYRFKMVKLISEKSYETIINPIYSRDFFWVDVIVWLTNSNLKIGSEGNTGNETIWQKKISDQFYTKLIPCRKDIIFEFERNREFVQQLLLQKVSISKPTYNISNKDIPYLNLSNYIVLFIGGGFSFRRWSIENFVNVALYLNSKYSLNIVLCGGKEDISNANIFQNQYSLKFTNLVGKISFCDFMQVLRKSKLLISNETSAPHLAMSLNVTTVVIYNGNHFGRFTPYPQNMDNKYHLVCHPEIEKDKKDYMEKSNSYKFSSKLNINDITPSLVIAKLNEILK